MVTNRGGASPDGPTVPRDGGGRTGDGRTGEDRAAAWPIFDDLEAAGRDATGTVIADAGDPEDIARASGWVEACATLLARHRDGAATDEEVHAAIRRIVATWVGPHGHAAADPAAVEQHRVEPATPTPEPATPTPEVARPTPACVTPPPGPVAADDAEAAKAAWLAAITPWREGAGRTTAQALRAMPAEERERARELATAAGIWVVGVE